MNYMAMHIFHHAHPKIIEITFSFPEFASACKQPVHSIYSFLRYSPFVTMSTKKILDQLLVYVNLYQHAKNQAISFIWSEDIVD